MIELMKVVLTVGLVLGVVMGAERLCAVLIRKLNINRKVLRNAAIVILSIAASISGVLWVLKDRLEE